MLKKIKIVFFLCFCAGIAYTSEDDGTFLSRICEYDVKNTIGLKSSGNYIIKSEAISYCFDTGKISYSSYENKDENVKIVYRYIIKKMLPSGNNTFGLSRRNRSHGSRGGGGMTVSDQKLDKLNVLVNGKKTKVNYKDTPYMIIDENFNPIKDGDIKLKDEQFDKFITEYITNGYLGWYYFDVDFSNSDEASIEINYTSKGGFKNQRYNSKPFWIPVSDDAELKVSIENKWVHSFLYYITGCDPFDTLTTNTWRLEKTNQNTVVITYAPGWSNENKEINFIFIPLIGGGPSGTPQYFEVRTEEEKETGSVYLTYFNVGRRDILKRDIHYNLSQRELGQYELIFLNREQLRIMRNAFYAIYKYRFNDKRLDRVLYNYYFKYDSIPDSWYNLNFSENLLSPIERKNIEIIQNLENMRF